MSKRKVTESVKKSVAAKQDFKCANFPGSNIISDYECVYHQCRSGTFDEAGYEIDHVVEFSETQDDKISNLQALCIPCHRVKTIRFNREKKSKAKTKSKAKRKLKANIFKIKLENSKHSYLCIKSESEKIGPFVIPNQSGFKTICDGLQIDNTGDILSGSILEEQTMNPGFGNSLNYPSTYNIKYLCLDKKSINKVIKISNKNQRNHILSRFHGYIPSEETERQLSLMSKQDISIWLKIDNLLSGTRNAVEGLNPDTIFGSQKEAQKLDIYKNCFD